MPSQVQQAAEYRRLALAEIALVESSTLANVREKHELAAARWDDLAEQTERAIAAHRARPRAAQVRRSGSPDGQERATCELGSLVSDTV